MSNIIIGSIVQIGFKNDYPISISEAVDFITCKVIFIYTDFNSYTYYFVSPVEDFSRYSKYFYTLDNGLLDDIKSVHQNVGEISNIRDYIGSMHKIVSTQDIKIKKLRFEDDGCNCIQCKEFYPYAVPNQANNILICYSCRDRSYR